MQANFRELRYGEVRRITLLRTRVNKGKREARSPQGPRAQRGLAWREEAGGATMNMQDCWKERRRSRSAKLWRQSSRS